MTTTHDDTPPPRAACDRLTREEWDRLHLSTVHILRRVRPESALGVLEGCPVVHLEPGDYLLHKNQANQVMYVVLTGRLAVSIQHPAGDPIAFLETGQTVGEISVLDDSPATAWVRAVTPCRLLAVDETAFWRLVNVSHAFTKNLLVLLAQRLRSNNGVLETTLDAKEHLEREASVDALTGLHNRRWLDAMLPRLVARHHRAGQPLSLLMMDIDHFKGFNDTYGHLAGDAVLAAVAQAVVTRLRPTDLAARFGGEELCVLLPQTPVAGAQVAAERIRNAVRTMEVQANGARLPTVTISIGAAQLGPGEDGKALLDRADGALYHAKTHGRDQVCCAALRDETGPATP